MLSLTRRRLLQSGSVFAFGFALGTPFSAVRSQPWESRSLSAWVSVNKDNTFTIVSPADEMGQGSMTSIPMIFAEEFDLDWEQVRIEFSAADDSLYFNPTSWVRGIMLTLGSSAVSGYYQAVRQHGAQARRIMMLTAARHWGTHVDRLRSEAGTVIDSRGGRKISYAELAAMVDTEAALPDVSDSDLKDPAGFSIIGRDIPRYDIPAKVDGSARYSIDVNLPDMLYAAVTHSPVPGGSAGKIINRRQLLAREHVLDIVTVGDAVAVVGDNYWACQQVESALQVSWNKPESLQHYSSDSALQLHRSLLRDEQAASMTIQQVGDINTLDLANATSYEEEYFADYLYHAQLEPLNAVADVRDSKATVWVGTQAPTHCLRSVAEALDMDQDKITIKRHYMGGGFGRRGAQDQDYVIDAVLLSRRFNKPVKVIWRRETDVIIGRFKPMKAMLLRATEDKNGRLNSWYHRTVSDEALQQSDPYRYAKAGGWPVISSNGMAIDYDIEHIQAEIIDPRTGMRAAPHRGIGGTVNKFASESFLDEIALQKNVDPLDLRLQMLHKHERARQVLERVAAMSQWNQRGESSGLGLAFDSVYYATAYVVRVEVDRASGQVRVPEVWVAMDVGQAIHPRNVEGQVEGQIIFAISNVLKERITVKDGVVQQSNFHDYPVMRMAEIPEIHMDIISQVGAEPQGVGDSRLGALPAAIGNGFASATGKRLRHMPFYRNGSNPFYDLLTNQ